MTESQRTRKLDRELRELGAMVLPIVAGNMQPAGWPDRYVASKQWTGWLEFKSENGKLSPLQRATMKDLQARGTSCHVVRFGNELEIENLDGYLVARVHDGRSLLEALRHKIS